MPQAVTHIIIAIVLLSLFRDLFKNKKKFPLHYVLIGGIAGLLPDLDIVAYWGLYFLGLPLSSVHRTFTHTIFIVLLFLILAFASWKVNIKEIGKHHLKLHNIFLVIAFGCFLHLLLDFLLIGSIMPLYPILTYKIGLNLVNMLPKPLADVAIPSLDAVILVLWLVYIEVRHKISNFL